MMGNFAQILLRMLEEIYAPSMRNHFGDATPFKVQVKFDIPLFEVHIGVDSLDK